MKNKFIIGVIGVVVGLVLIGCDTDGVPDDPSPKTASYTSVNGSDTYTLSVTESSSRAVFAAGDSYTLKIESAGETKISSGTIQAIVKEGWKLKPSNAPDIFTVDVCIEKMITVNGTITFNTGENKIVNKQRLAPEGFAGSPTKFEGSWVGTWYGGYETYETQFEFRNNYIAQRFWDSGSGRWVTESIWTTFTDDGSKITCTDSGDGTPIDLVYTLDGTTLTFTEYSLAMTKQD